MSVAQEVLEVIQLLNSLTNLVQGMAPQQNQLAKEPSPYAIYTDVEITRQALTAGIYSLPAIVQRLAEIQSSLVQLGIPQQAFEPVVLPKTAPPGYGGPSSSVVAAEVWAFPDPNTGQPTVDLLADAGLLAINMTTAEVGLPVIGNPPWIGAGAWTSTAGPMRPDTSLPIADTSTILATDATIADWLNRAYPGHSIFDVGNGWAAAPDLSGALQWVYGLSPLEFAQIKAGLTPSAATVVPPVWPGLAKVTLGTPVAITSAMSGLTVPGPLDGVITAIATVPVPIGYYSFDGDKSFVHLGGIAFQSDDGQDEAAQPMTFQAQVIVPRSMSRASAAKVRIQSGTTGTITPWTIT